MKKNRNLLFIVLICSIVLTITAQVSYADEKIPVDNPDIQQYRGKLGQWKLLESSGQLRFYIKKYHTSYREFHSINGSKIKYNNYYFLPYAQKYLMELKKKNVTRKKYKTSRDDFIWPIEDINRITSPFGMRWGLFHNGVDLPRRRGAPVVAAMDGIVVQSGYSGGYGNTISIKCRNSLFTRYSHNSVLLVKKGELVKKGQVIAFVGSTGNSTGNHLHFEIRYKNIPLNPLDFLPKKEKIIYGLNPDLK